jgi:hypothetical protein
MVPRTSSKRTQCARTPTPDRPPRDKEAGTTVPNYHGKCAHPSIWRSGGTAAGEHLPTPLLAKLTSTRAPPLGEQKLAGSTWHDEDPSTP